jgi:hypothetical protein
MPTNSQSCCNGGPTVRFTDRNAGGERNSIQWVWCAMERTQIVDIQPPRRQTLLSLVVGYLGKVAVASLLISFWAVMGVRAFQWVTSQF